MENGEVVHVKNEDRSAINPHTGKGTDKAVSEMKTTWYRSSYKLSNWKDGNWNWRGNWCGVHKEWKQICYRSHTDIKIDKVVSEIVDKSDTGWVTNEEIKKTQLNVKKMTAVLME